MSRLSFLFAGSTRAEAPLSGHPSCLDFTESLLEQVQQYPWECIECKKCEVCSKNDGEVSA